MSVTALELEEVTPDESIAVLEQRWGISRNALKSRAKALGVELIRKGPTLTVWPGDRIADGDRLDAHLKAGGAMASFPAVAAVAAVEPQPSVTPHGRSDGSQLAVTGEKADQLALLAAALASAMPQSAADPLQRARALAEAADNGLVLENSELKALGVRGVAGRTEPVVEAHGYRFHRHMPGTTVLWTVERAITASGAPAVTATPSRTGRVGFGAAIEATATVLGRVELPHWQPSLPSAHWQ